MPGTDETAPPRLGGIATPVARLVRPGLGKVLLGAAVGGITIRDDEAGRAVEAFVARIGQSRYREMLRMRFLSYLTIEEAAERMGYSYDAGKRLSAQAMRTARAIWEAEHATE